MNRPIPLNISVAYEEIENEMLGKIFDSHVDMQVNGGKAICSACGDEFSIYSPSPHSSVSCKQTQLRNDYAGIGICLVSEVQAGTLSSLGHEYLIIESNVSGYRSAYVNLWVFACLQLATSLSDLARRLHQGADDVAGKYRMACIIELSMSLKGDYSDRYTSKAIDFFTSGGYGPEDIL